MKQLSERLQGARRYTLDPHPPATSLPHSQILTSSPHQNTSRAHHNAPDPTPTDTRIAMVEFQSLLERKLTLAEQLRAADILVAQQVCADIRGYADTDIRGYPRLY